MEKWCVVLMNRKKYLERKLNNDRSYGYFNWLVEQIGERNNRVLLWHLYNTPFRWYIELDLNRVDECYNLREEFNLDDEFDHPVSVLEVIYVLAKRCKFNTEGDDSHKEMDESGWFWKLIDNLGLTEYDDSKMGHPDYGPVYYEEVDQRLDIFLDRKYERNGRGGLFPLKYCRKDQRKVELWYQMGLYLVENRYDNAKKV
jgi:hypothetical protein